jgi:hypothetical protein
VEHVTIDTSALTEIPAGPRLSAALATINPATLSGFDLVELITARGRQISYEQAQLLRAVHELAYTPPSVTERVERTDKPDEYVVGEVAFAMCWTHHRANSEVAFALEVIDRIPAVFDALARGAVDVAKAKVICDELDLVEDEQARAIAAALLAGETSRATTGHLRARIRRLVLAVNPDAVRVRHAKAVADRGVHHHEYASGTSMLAGFYLPKDKAAAAWDNVDRIARATRAAGSDPRTMDQLRADIFADLLAGVEPAVAGYATPGERNGVIHLHVGLSTLAGLSDYPGEIDGFGPVLADIARQAAAQMGQSALWRYTVVDADGTAVAEGRLRYRPTVDQANFVRARDATCRAPGCRKPAIRCDLDHITDWAHGGPTTIDNLCCLCRAHHRLKHEAGHEIHPAVHGIDWTTPRGHHYTVLPENHPPPSPLVHALTDYLPHRSGPSHLRR